MIRRQFLAKSVKALAATGLARTCSWATKAGAALPGTTPSASPAKVLAGTEPLTDKADLVFEMEDGIVEYLRKRTKEVPQERAQWWHWDYYSAQAYEKSVAPHREHLRKIAGAVDPRVAPASLGIIARPEAPEEVARGENYKVLEVRWPVFDAADFGLCGMQAEGLLLEPDGPAKAHLVAIPDADWTPEMLAGLVDGVPAKAQFARRLAENGCQVLVPMLINRADTFSGNPEIRMTNEPHREFVYRIAYELGRHIIGYEVQKVLAAVDWFCSHDSNARIGVMGFGEGGLIAFYAAALDSRIDATVVSGYFDERENLSAEPIYRNIWGLLREFGDAEIASLIAPRTLIIEACRGPEVNGPPPAVDGRSNMACPVGRLSTPSIESVRREAKRAREIFAPFGVGELVNGAWKYGASSRFQLVERDNGIGLPGGEETISALLIALGVEVPLAASGNSPQRSREGTDPQSRLHSQFNQMVAFTEGLAKRASERRAEFWSRADSSSLDRWVESTRPLRDEIWSEIFGRLPDASMPPNVRTRLVYDTPQILGYEVWMDVWPGVNNYGILLLPKDLKPGERRPVVVCQHGLEARVQEVADPGFDSQFYRQWAVSLTKMGFVTYSPQNPFFGAERFRAIYHLGHPLKLQMFSFVLGQHQQMLNWLSQEPYVDPERIGFYGMSYGGKTAFRVPPLLDRYALDICSGDFNDLVWVMTDVDSRGVFPFDDSYDLYEFNAVNVINYAEMACLMAPRPYMAEHGWLDGGDPIKTDEGIASQFVLVQHFYERMGIADRLAIEYFEGPHTINGKGTFEFLRKQLRLGSA
ncbi:MAG TPA: dienelactone hydrolase family protein [Terracidiphilus sp.]|nr:dienelactone hydrolase family protein [Terracidiphilus sp.]